MLASRRFFAVMRAVIVSALFAVSAPVLTANSAFAQLQGTQTQGTIAPIPVAILGATGLRLTIVAAERQGRRVKRATPARKRPRLAAAA